LYNGYKDCFKKVVRYEGFGALYNGIGSQCLGVGPEKAIKLTMNDLCRDFFRKDGVVPVPLEILSGGIAGGCQVLFTNPLEIVKIRMQLDPMATLAGTAKEVGLRNLYKGASACLLRDIPFSAIYFPAYAHLKQMLSNEDGHLPIEYTLLAGFLAGFPAAGLTTPADVIKTRLQAKPAPGQDPYKGLISTGARIYKEEGFSALWKGIL
jgi:solute carrier family 25 aspartate/glutamate transporter 12/13